MTLHLPRSLEIEPIIPHAGMYRPDIDGLRAVAVLAVILFHINPHWLPGGFVGVDVFFVISGYLITGIVAKELQEGRFTIKAFYERRIRRILPALWALLLVCLPISFWLMLPADAEAMAKSAMWSILAMANVYFWREVTTDYFAPQSAQMPFLHLWSLGVEEQFYVLWPLALMVTWTLWRRRPRALAAALAVALVCCSTLFAEWLIAAQEIRFAYYMLPARAGELAVGAALALAWPQLAELVRSWRVFGDGAAVLGWGLLVVSVFWLSEHEPFPGWRALLPTLGAVSLIAAGHVGLGSFWLRPLCHPASIWLGRCSYSAYLWHWPVLAWWRYLWWQPGGGEGLGLLALILLLAGVSQRWIEEPARRDSGSWGRTLSLYFLMPVALLGVMALMIARGERWGLPLYPAAQLQGWAELENFTRPVHHLDWVCQQHVLNAKTLTDPSCEFGGGNESTQVMLLGDSHAAQFAPLIRSAAEIQGVRVRSVALGSCPALPGPLAGVVSDSRLAACEEGMRQVLARAEDFRLLIIGGAWAGYAQRDPRVWERLEAHLYSLTARGHQVWLLPRVPEVRGYDAACSAKRLRVGDWLRCPTTLPQTEPNDDTNDRLAQVAGRVPGVHFLPLRPGLCREAHCPVADAQGHFLYSDGSHLSVYGAQQLAADLQQEGRLPDLRQR